MTLDQTLDLVRIGLSIGAPALVLAAALKRAPKRKLVRIAAVSRGRPVRRADPSK